MDYWMIYWINKYSNVGLLDSIPMIVKPLFSGNWSLHLYGGFLADALRKPKRRWMMCWSSGALRAIPCGGAPGLRPDAEGGDQDGSSMMFSAYSPEFHFVYLGKLL